MSDSVTTDQIFADLWARLVRARHDRKSEWRWFTVATSGLDSAPRARTVLLRDVAQTELRVDFHTDRRSAKFGELVHDPSVALHFFDRRAAMQVRMIGRATVLNDEHTSRIWVQLNEVVRANYRHATAPGTKLDTSGALPARADAKALLTIGVQRNAIITVDDPPAPRSRLRERLNIFGKETCPRCIGPVAPLTINGRRAFGCENCQPIVEYKKRAV